MTPPERATALWSRIRRRGRRWRKKHGPEVLYAFRFGPGDTDQDPSHRPAAELRELTPELLAAMAHTYPRELVERKRAILESRIDDPTQTCWVIVADGEPAGYCHVSWSDTVNERINHRVELQPGQAYFYDDFVFRKHRRKGLHLFSIARRLQLAGDRGATEGVTTITRTNTASRASYGRMGAVPTHRLVHLPPLHRTVQLPIRTGGRPS